MKVIDTNISKKRHAERLDNSRYLKGKAKKYDLSDFALVRATDFLPQDGILMPLCSVPFVTHTNNVASSVIFKLLQENYNLDPFNEEDYKKLKEMANKYSPLSSQYRSTIHFTLNGLVSNHSKGEFDNRNFIIIDKLANHLGKEDFRSLRMEDTFVKGPFKLSSDAVILINKDKYGELLKDNPWLNDYHVTLFTGDEKTATEEVLLDLGITPEDIKEHGAEYSNRTPLHMEALDRLAKTYNCELEKHVYSKEYRDDDEKNLRVWEIFNRAFYDELCSTFKLEPKDEIVSFLSSYDVNRQKQEEKLKELVMQIGLVEYSEFVLSYNKKITDRIAARSFPTNEQLLLGGVLNISGNLSEEKTYQ